MRVLTHTKFSEQTKRHPGTYIVVAHSVHIVLQVTFAIVGQNDATQFAIAGKVEACISGEHQQTGHIPPTNLLLRNEQETFKV